jgi:glyoxylase-like metal-dependent hydrolase (beta-lactamase superfamily II)
VLDAGVEALGGIGRLRGTEDVSLSVRGVAYDQGQSANPESPYFVRPVEGTRVIDVRNKNTRFETRTSFRGGSSYWGRQVLRGNSGFILDLISDVIYPLAPSAVANSFRSAQRLLPHLLLQEALSRAATLRWLEERGGRAGGHLTISFADTSGNQIALYFDARSHLLTKYEAIGDDPVFGDVLRETSFSGYKDVEGVKIPSKVVLKYAGEVVLDLNYSDVKLNTRPNGELFEVPAGLEQGPEILGPLSPTLTKLADGVYFVNGVNGGDVWFYSQMFVVFKDYVLVVESPLNEGVSQAVIAKIKEAAPGRPIKYLVPTHYHFDHIGGIRSYIAEGATVVTTPGNRGLVERIAAARHTIVPDALSLRGGKPLIETFTDKRVFSDGNLSVEIYNLGGGPHVDEMVIAYIPRDKIVFVSDLCMPRIKGRLPPPSATELDFARKIRGMNLPIAKIANGHGWLGTMEAFLESLGDARQ